MLSHVYLENNVVKCSVCIESVTSAGQKTSHDVFEVPKKKIVSHGKAAKATLKLPEEAFYWELVSDTDIQNTLRGTPDLGESSPITSYE